MEIEQGYSLKKRQLKRWIYEHNYTQPYIADKLGLTAEEFKRKLREKEWFNKAQISALIYLLGAKSAFEIIYFPTLDERKRVYRQAFGTAWGEQ